MSAGREAPLHTALACWLWAPLGHAASHQDIAFPNFRVTSNATTGPTGLAPVTVRKAYGFDQIPGPKRGIRRQLPLGEGHHLVGQLVCPARSRVRE